MKSILLLSILTLFGVKFEDRSLLSLNDVELNIDEILNSSIPESCFDGLTLTNDYRGKTIEEPKQKKLSIEFSGEIISSNKIAINFTALIGANPKDLSYYVAIWQGGKIMSYASALQTKALITSKSVGSVIFENLDVSLEYIIGFGVNNKDVNTICSTVYIPAGTPLYETIDGISSTVSMEFLGASFVISSFDTPAYNLAEQNENWVAIFEGRLTSDKFNGTNVIAFSMVTHNTNNGPVAFDELKIRRFTTYTIVYGMGTLENGAPNYSNIVSATEFEST
jgi:hypothetical protein